MWPWEHAAIAYLCWAALDRRGARPDDAAVVAVLVGSQFPDLVDKPLSWVFQVLPTGQSLAHSLLFALPVIGLVVAVARASGRTAVGLAFGVGYLSHLPADAVYPVVFGGEPRVSGLLYPLVEIEPYAVPGVGPRLAAMAENVVPLLSSPLGILYVLADAALVAAAFVVWYRNDCPGLRLVRRWVPGLEARAERSR